MLLAVFKLVLEMDYPSETRLCTVAPSPTDTPSLVFSKWRGRRYTGSLKWIIHLQSNCPWKLTDKVRRIVHSKLKVFCLSGVKTAISLIMNVATRPWVGRSDVCFCFFTKIIFKLTIDISMCKMILEKEYFIKSMIYQMLKLFKRIAYFIPRWFEDLYFAFKIKKIQVN